MQKRYYEQGVLNRLFVVDKPMFISSNFYLNKFKREFKNKKAGFSGTLDPFATGCLIVAFGKYAKLFKYLKKSPKVYKAVIWLGVESESFDIERVLNIGFEEKVDEKYLKEVVESLKGEINYTPPKFSAKRVNGIKAYELAREGFSFDLQESKMSVYDIKLLQYNHPFISFEAEVSEGSYIRSLAQIILEKISKKGTLSYLQRVREGEFTFQNHKFLDPLEYIDLPRNNYFGTKEWIKFGKKISIDYLELKGDGKYIVECDDIFSIIVIENSEVKYLLNDIEKVTKS